MKKQFLERIETKKREKLDDKVEQHIKTQWDKATVVCVGMCRVIQKTQPKDNRVWVGGEIANGTNESGMVFGVTC